VTAVSGTGPCPRAQIPPSAADDAACLDVVTGAFSYTGRAIAGRLLAAGRAVRTLTAHPDRDEGRRRHIDVAPLAFDDPAALAHSLTGVHTLYNTYWIRFPHRATHFATAVDNSRRLFEAAARSGVARIVHVSITNPSLDSPYGYFRGKAEVERSLAESGIPHAVIRPTVVFGGNDVLINNIAWLLRHVPFFVIPGDGRYRLRPVHVDDVARLCVEQGMSSEDVVLDAVGPERFTFTELVQAIGDGVGRHARLVHLPPSATSLVTAAVGAAVRDVVLTRDELAGMMDGLADSDAGTTGAISLSGWLRENGGGLGRRYASELNLHYRPGARRRRPESP
jgi:NADH dehydrogenase